MKTGGAKSFNFCQGQCKAPVPSPELASVRWRSLCPSYLSPPPSGMLWFPLLASWQVRPPLSPSLLLIGAQVGESPPRAYVRVRAVPAHLAFELRRFWLQFTSLPAFSARCSAWQSSARKATGGGKPRPEKPGERRKGEKAKVKRERRRSLLPSPENYLAT